MKRCIKHTAKILVDVVFVVLILSILPFLVAALILKNVSDNLEDN